MSSEDNVLLLFSSPCLHFAKPQDASSTPVWTAIQTSPCNWYFNQNDLLKSILYDLCCFTYSFSQRWNQKMVGDAWFSLFRDILSLPNHFLTAGNVDIHLQIIWRWQDVLNDMGTVVAGRQFKGPVKNTKLMRNTAISLVSFHHISFSVIQFGLVPCCLPGLKNKNQSELCRSG